MVKIRGPLLSIEAHGWLGGYFYQTHFVNPFPYPISLLGRIREPYFMPAFGIRPYPSFIAQYYSPTGWEYNQRRTWHGMQPTASRSPGLKRVWINPNDPYRVRFRDAVTAWHTFNQTTKDIYNKLKYPPRMTGYNRFIRQYIKTQPLTPTTPSYILVEAGSKLLVEVDSGLLVSG